MKNLSVKDQFKNIDGIPHIRVKISQNYESGQEYQDKPYGSSGKRLPCFKEFP